MQVPTGCRLEELSRFVSVGNLACELIEACRGLREEFEKRGKVAITVTTGIHLYGDQDHNRVFKRTMTNDTLLLLTNDTG